MNIPGDKKLLCIVNVHSSIDLITNSSTEIFCAVEGKSKEHVEEVIDSILKEFGCKCCSGYYSEYGIYVQKYEKWDEESGNYVETEGQYAIWYDQHNPPCDMIKKKLAETFTVLNVE